MTSKDNQEKQKFLVAFGNRIRKYRNEKQMSLDELARKCGYTSENARSSIQKIEAGKSDIPASKIQLISKALAVPISEIMGWTNEWDDTYDTNQLQQEVDLIERIQKSYGKTTSEVVSLYIQLDLDDQSQIRGEMKQMLKADKYSNEKTFKVKIAARNGEFKETNMSDAQLEEIMNLPDVDDLI